jgi:hypothetical protein
MAGRAAKAKTDDDKTEPQAPAFWIAGQDLFVPGGDGAMPARAFAKGDRVPDEHVQRFGWQNGVTDPSADQPDVETVPDPAQAGEPVVITTDPPADSDPGADQDSGNAANGEQS